jgi:hypothetical protein
VDVGGGFELGGLRRRETRLERTRAAAAVFEARCRQSVGVELVTWNKGERPVRVVGGLSLYSSGSGSKKREPLGSGCTMMS